MAASSLSVSQDAQSERFVIARMLSSLPGSVRYVCVVRAALFKPGTWTRETENFSDINSRISTDRRACLNHERLPPVDARIIYFSDVANAIARNHDLWNHSFLSSFVKAEDYARKGYVLAGAFFDRCNAPLTLFILFGDRNKPILIDTLTIGYTKCVTERK